MKLATSVFLFPLIGVVAAFGQPICIPPGDLNGDSSVNLQDFQMIADCLGGPGQAAPPEGCNPADAQLADLDDDGDVDLRDYLRHLEHFGGTFFHYGPARANGEAERLAMDVSGELRAPDEEYNRILNDLALIRQMFPPLVSVVDDPDYVPTHLIVSLFSGQSLNPYKELNRFYQSTGEQVLFGSTFLLTFCGPLNMPVLAQEYADLAVVNYAEPDGFFGHDDRITVTQLGTAYRYSIDDGFHDCFDGCDCHRLWEIEVNNQGVVSLISYSEQGLPWCDF